MTLVDTAFDNLRRTLEITKTEAVFASSKQNDIRAHVRENWALSEDFLTGSYRRETKTKRLKDVDMFIVVDPEGEQAQYREQGPNAVLSALKPILDERYDIVTVDGFACTIAFGSEDEVASFDVVPAFDRDAGGWDIPDARRGRWIATDPKRHHEASTAKNKECDGKFVPLVKMIKGMNREADEPIKPSFLLEVMAHSIVDAPFGRFQDEVVWFLATATERAGEKWPDPAGIGPDVNGTWSQADSDNAVTTFRDWQRIAEQAIALEDDGSERAAVEEWRRLFGSRMPRP